MRARLIKPIISIIAALTVMLTLVTVAHAALKPKPSRSPFTDPYQEYIYDVNDFYKDRQAYTSALSQYKAYQTAQSKETAFDTAKVMLESGRIALKQYLFLLKTNLEQQEEFNPRVKSAILADIDAHSSYLDTSMETITQAETLSQVTDLGKAMDLRITYIRFTGTQALGYIDAVTTKKRIDESRAIVNKFSSILDGYPPENRSKQIIEKWIQESIPDLAVTENQLSVYVEALYPIPVQGSDKPAYEANKNPANPALLRDAIAKQRNYATKFKEMNTIARTAYQEL